ncbi:MAG: hypothetical protein HYY90_06035 [Candidatus Omnitrophica bacterium]|nr:hypothetical protein [Candidatus Omnitrophota bacterium]MBI3021173.1 hypothetical protein [Candidatus Omnitrophota bacterium]MBI3083906.1 hypothetical protein [Candidatus Omnitrophota bacterium]
MGLVKRVPLRKHLLTVLLGVVAVLVPGVLRSTGLFRPMVPPRAPSTALDAAPSLRGAAQAAEPQAPSVLSETSVRLAVKPSAQATYTAASLRDPLRSLLPQGPTLEPQSSASLPAMPERGVTPPMNLRPPTFAIQGLLWGGREPKAIIDGEVYGVGDVVQGATITSIGREGITVDLGGHSMDLAMGQEGAKGPAPFAGFQGRQR